MKLVTYRLSGAEHVGALTADGKGVLPLPAADMNTLIETMTLADLRSAAAAAERGGAVPLSDVELLAPIPRPRQDVVCLGMNYRDHAEESARYSADAFTKNSTAAVYFSKRVSEAGKPDGVIPVTRALTDRWTMRRSWRWCWAKPPGRESRRCGRLHLRLHRPQRRIRPGPADGP